MHFDSQSVFIEDSTTALFASWLCRRVPVPGWSGIVHQASQEFGLSKMMLGLAKHGIPKRHHVGLAIPIFLAIRIESFFSEAAGLTILDQHNQSGVPPKYVNVFLPPIHGRVFRNKTLGLPQFQTNQRVLVGGIPTPLKNMSSSVGMIIPNWMESHKIPWFQSPPTSVYICRVFGSVWWSSPCQRSEDLLKVTQSDCRYPRRTWQKDISY